MEKDIRKKIKDILEHPLYLYHRGIKKCVDRDVDAVIKVSMEGIRKKLEAHAKQNTYEDNEAAVFRTTMKEVLDLLPK